MSRFLWVALGGALGAVLRYAVSLIPVRGGFPVLTLLTNLLGALLIGFIAGAAEISDIQKRESRTVPIA